ncbi:hypothetical protein F4604DRAFT_1934896 [Suillus subluteus]|nr:hypothetical protein F4604DRAFT_1934896 [Suillus subluteus]
MVFHPPWPLTITRSSSRPSVVCITTLLWEVLQMDGLGLSSPTAFNLAIGHDHCAMVDDNIIFIWIVRLSGPTAFNLAIGHDHCAMVDDNIIFIWIVWFSGPAAFNLAIGHDHCAV